MPRREFDKTYVWLELNVQNAPFVALIINLCPNRLTKRTGLKYDLDKIVEVIFILFFI